MSKYVISDWINSAGGPLIVMEEVKAPLWNGSSEDFSSDYDLACQADGYAGKLVLYGTDVLVLGDEPLQTMLATSVNQQLIVGCIWADSEADVLAAIEQIDFSKINIIEKLTINWLNQPLVLFDAADIFDPTQCLKLSTHRGVNEVATFIYQPTSRISLLVHAIYPNA